MHRCALGLHLIIGNQALQYRATLHLRLCYSDTFLTSITLHLSIMAVASKSSMRAMVPHVEASDENFQEGLDLADANDETLRKTIESRHGHGTKDRAPSSPSVSMHPAPQTIPLNDIATKESAAKSQPGFGKLFTRPASAGTPLDTGFAYAVAQKPKLDLVGGNRKGPAARQETSGDHKNVTEMKSSEGQTSKPEQSNATDGESHDRDVQDQHHGERAFKADGEASVIAEKTLDGPEEPLGPSGFPDEEEQDQKETSSTRAEAGTDYNPKEAPEELAPPQQPEEATKPDGVKSGHGAQSMLSCDVSLNKARPNAPAAGEEQADMEEMSDQLDNALESGFFDAEDGTTLIQHDSPHSEHRQTEVIGGMERQGKHRSRSSASPSSRSRQHTPEVRRPTQLPTNTSLLHEVAQSHGASKVEKTSKRKRAACDTSKPKLKTTSLLCALVDSFEADAKQRDEQAGMVKKQQKALSEKAELIGYYEQQLSYAYDRMQALGKQQDKIEHLKLQQQDTQRILHSEEAANVKLSERISKYKQLKHANVQELERLSQELQESRANRRNVQEEKEKLAADVKQKEQKLQHEKDITQKLSRDLAEAKQVAHGQWNDLLSSTESKIEGHIRRMQETIEKQPKFDPGKLNNIIGIVQQISSRPLDIGPALEKIDAVAGSVTTLGERSVHFVQLSTHH